MAKVTKVIDGDTFETNSGQRIRLANVDAPEKGQKRAALATAKLRDEVEGKTVSIKPVGVSYGRVVADVKIGPKSVNRVMQRFVKNVAKSAK